MISRFVQFKKLSQNDIKNLQKYVLKSDAKMMKKTLKIDPKMDPKSMKNLSKNRCENDTKKGAQNVGRREPLDPYK